MCWTIWQFLADDDNDGLTDEDCSMPPDGSQGSYLLMFMENRVEYPLVRPLTMWVFSTLYKSSCLIYEISVSTQALIEFLWAFYCVRTQPPCKAFFWENVQLSCKGSDCVNILLPRKASYLVVLSPIARPLSVWVLSSLARPLYYRVSILFPCKASLLLNEHSVLL